MTRSYTFEPTGRGVVQCNRFIDGEPQGPVFFARNVTPVSAVFTQAEWDEYL